MHSLEMVPYTDFNTVSSLDGTNETLTGALQETDPVGGNTYPSKGIANLDDPTQLQTNKLAKAHQKFTALGHQQPLADSPQTTRRH